MRTSAIITTCCGDPLAWDQSTGAGDRSKPHKARADLLIEEILPAYLKEPFTEIFVGGRIHDDVKDAFDNERLTFVHVPPKRRDRSEALNIRETVTRFSTGDLLVYAADDHRPAEGFVKSLHQLVDEAWDVLTPRRYHGKTGEQMADGEGHVGGYSPLHLHVLRREVWAKIPWTAIDTTYIDVSHARLCREAGFELAWSDKIRAFDVEAEVGEL